MRWLRITDRGAADDFVDATSLAQESPQPNVTPCAWQLWDGKVQ